MTPSARDMPFRHYVRVRYQDCDSQHVVFNARYGDYIDLAVTQFLMASMPGRDPFDGSFEIQLKKQTIEWFGPFHFNEVIEIATWVSRFGRTSFDVRFELRRPVDPEAVVVADTVYVHVHGEKGVFRSAPLPDEARALLEAGAKGKIVDHAGHLPVVLPG